MKQLEEKRRNHMPTWEHLKNTTKQQKNGRSRKTTNQYHNGSNKKITNMMDQQRLKGIQGGNKQTCHY
jgi:hypothetical protein